MRLRVLGSSGGIGGRRRTTALLVDGDLLLDAGTGVGDLSLEEMARLRTVFLTHAHLDHVAGLFLLLDSVHAMDGDPITVRGLPETLEAVARHLSNDAVWPDFRRIPSPEAPSLTFEPLAPETPVRAGGRTLTALPVRHTIPATGYHVSDPGGAFAFTGDTGRCPGFWEGLNRRERLDRLFVEISFPDDRSDLAARTGHYTPAVLAEDLHLLRHSPEIWVTHPKPGMEEAIVSDCRRVLAGRNLRLLAGGEVFTF